MSSDSQDSDYEDETQTSTDVPRRSGIARNPAGRGPTPSTPMSDFDQMDQNYPDYAKYHRNTRQRKAAVKKFLDGNDLEEDVPNPIAEPKRPRKRTAVEHQHSSDSGPSDSAHAKKKRRTAVGPTKSKPAKKAQPAKHSVGNHARAASKIRYNAVGARTNHQNESQARTSRRNTLSRKALAITPEAKVIVIRVAVVTGSPPKNLTATKQFHLHQVAGLDRCRDLVNNHFRLALTSLGFGMEVEVISYRLERIEHVRKSDFELGTDDRWMVIDNHRAFESWLDDVKTAIGLGRIMQPRIQLVVHDDHLPTTTSLSHTPGIELSSTPGSSSLLRANTDKIEPKPVDLDGEEQAEKVEFKQRKIGDRALKNSLTADVDENLHLQNEVTMLRSIIDEDGAEIRQLRRDNKEQSAIIEQLVMAGNYLLINTWKARAGIDISGMPDPLEEGSMPGLARKGIQYITNTAANRTAQPAAKAVTSSPSSANGNATKPQEAVEDVPLAPREPVKPNRRMQLENFKKSVDALVIPGYTGRLSGGQETRE